jgi:hypothetical protein
MKFLKIRNDLWTRITRHCNLRLAGYFAAAFWMLLFVPLRPACAWELFVAPHDNNFGNVILDNSSGPQAFEICNIGTRDLRITQLSLSDTTNYSLNLNSGENECKSTSPTIAAYKCCTVEVTFHPISLGIKNARFQISVSDSNESPLKAVLVGRGVTVDDNEGDGLPDAWERQIVDADPNDQIRSIEDVKPDDDFDGDGATNSQEFKNGSNPINASPNTPGFTLQASIEIGEELVLGLVSDIYLNSLQVPVFALDLSRRYFWPPSLANRVGQISAPLVEQY